MSEWNSRDLFLSLLHTVLKSNSDEISTSLCKTRCSSKQSFCNLNVGWQELLQQLKCNAISRHFLTQPSQEYMYLTSTFYRAGGSVERKYKYNEQKSIVSLKTSWDAILQQVCKILSPEFFSPLYQCCNVTLTNPSHLHEFSLHPERLYGLSRFLELKTCLVFENPYYYSSVF